VKQLGGSVHAFSEGRGQGTTMRVELPIAPAASGS
jgi:signal transduction histidine kinase